MEHFRLERVVADIQGWDSQPQHRTGTEGDRATSEWLAGEIEKTGLEARIQEFEFPRRTPLLCNIQIGESTIEGVPLFDGGITGRWGTTTKLSLASEGTGITDGEYVSIGSDVDTRLLYQHRSNPKVVGVVGISKMPWSGIPLLNADDYKTPFGVPFLQVDHQHRDLLLNAAKSGRKATLNVHFNLNLVNASNVETLVKGKKPRALSPVVIMTPKSSWWTSTAERCGGIVLLLEAMRHFAEHKPWRNVIFTANTGHELGHVGLEHFIKMNPKLIDHAHLWLHLGANFAAVDSKVRLQASCETLLKLGQKQFAYDSFTPIGQRPGGEARNIFDGCGAFFSILGSNSRFHHPSDRYPANVDTVKLLEIRDRFIEFADRMANER